MRITVVQRGLSHYRFEFYEALAQRAVVTVCFSRLPERVELGKLRYVVPGDHKATYIALPAMVFRRPITRLPIILTKGLARAVTGSRADVVLLEGESNLLNNLLVVPALVRRGTPFFWWGLGKLPGRSESPQRKLVKPIHRAILKRAAGAVCYSTHAQKYYESMGARRTIVAFNSLDTRRVFADISRCAPTSAGIRDQLGIPANAQIILFVGTLEPTKDLGHLIDAFALLRSAFGVAVALVIIGDGPSRGAFEAYVRRLGVGGVVFTGAQVADVSRLFLQASVFVLPGLGGLAVQQAMAHGLPVISALADGTEQDLIDHGVNGYLLPAGYGASVLADYIAKVLANDSLRLAMGRESERRIRELFNIQRTVEALVEGVRAETRG